MPRHKTMTALDDVPLSTSPFSRRIFAVAAAMKLPKVLDAFELPVHKMKVATFIGPSYFLYAAP